MTEVIEQNRIPRRAAILAIAGGLGVLGLGGIAVPILGCTNEPYGTPSSCPEDQGLTPSSDDVSPGHCGDPSNLVSPDNQHDALNVNSSRRQFNSSFMPEHQTIVANK